MKRFALLLVFGIITFGITNAQVEERQRPAEWEKLVLGGRLMVCRGGGVWISRDCLQPWRQITSERACPQGVREESSEVVIK